MYFSVNFEIDFIAYTLIFMPFRTTLYIRSALMEHVMFPLNPVMETFL